MKKDIKELNPGQSNPRQRQSNPINLSHDSSKKDQTWVSNNQEDDGSISLISLDKESSEKIETP